jgi:Protein of unknown function DUF115.
MQYSESVQKLKKLEAELLALSNRNIRFKDIHKGKRCFILCNGPSIKKQNLLPLQSEIVFSVSSGYLHKDYSIIKPMYHCSARLPFSDKLTKDIAEDWLNQMDHRILNAELFLDAFDEQFVREKNLFPQRKVNYLFCEGVIEEQREIIDISKKMYGVQSVSIMALRVAMYMGFRKIYLIGVEHDSFITRQYKHFYAELPEYQNKDTAVTDDGKVESLYVELHAAAVLWAQYRALKGIALANGISIYNATQGGALDEFKRVSLDEILS